MKFDEKHIDRVPHPRFPPFRAGIIVLLLAACDAGKQPTAPKPAIQAPASAPAKAEYEVEDTDNFMEKKLTIRIGDKLLEGPTGYLGIIDTADFNEDGVPDALVRSSTGGASCCEENDRFVSVVNGTVVEAEIPDWSNGEVVKENGHPLVKYESDDKTEFYTFDGKQAVKVRGIPHAVLETIAETPTLTNFANEENVSFEADINLDDKPERVTCDVWQRWGQFTACDFPLPGGGTQGMAFNPACQRVGALKTTRNGMRELVCDNNKLIYFDGKAWQQAKPRP
jgi:hypothetical protein